ncbi:Rad52/Rad22 family DNA repair protein [Paenibacillus tepidiphilus]|uniref:Rad52/Rad22 family DNA repair protein n=1 Tax=Paenibacillus tepidiphilus TaxID=2608683 RepID=UPI00123BE162|nr:Rad52/Rad22 family DNA repair protein [Paenibacillus tepidiphilus]
MNSLNENLFNQLNAPFPYEEYRINQNGYVYVRPQATSDRLNQVLGPHGWKLEVVSQDIDMKLFTVSIFGKLSIKADNGEWIDKCQFGDAIMYTEEGETQPQAQAILDAKKIALSDCLKKCASLIGVASDLYNGRITAILKSTVEYAKVVRAIDEPNFKFDKGIVVIPDDLKPYYEKNGSFAIFESDIKDILKKADIKEKFNGMFKSNADINTWINSMKEQGLSLIEMEYILEDQKNKNLAPVLTDQVNNVVIPLETPIHMILKELNVEGEEDPYYKCLMDYQGRPVEVFAVGPLMNVVDSVVKNIGQPYIIDIREAKGRNILRNIRQTAG